MKNNNMQKYLCRKEKEAILIGKYLSKYEPSKFNSFFDVLNEKEKITKELQKYCAEKYYHELTNKNRLIIKRPFIYNYTYERFNGFIEIQNFTNKFYNLNKTIYTTNYFTNCGMSAISAVLSSIVLSNEVNVDLMYEETYFETIKYISMITKNENDKKMIYIDSISSDFCFTDNFDFDKYIGIIIDTTCYLGKDYKKIIESSNKLNKFCILVRSHTKLDLLGTEFSHIGSVSFIFPKENKEKILFKKIEEDCRHIIGVMGACLPPNKFPLFLMNEKILKINEERLSIVCKNNNYFHMQMKKNNINCVIPNHKQFCIINFVSQSLTLNNFKKNIVRFCDSFKKEIPVYHAVSFGFDYISVDCYENYSDGKFKIRVCLNDMPIEYIDKFISKFIVFYEKILK